MSLEVRFLAGPPVIESFKLLFGRYRTQNGRLVDRKKTLRYLFVLKVGTNAFNARDIEAVLAVTHVDVDWPNGMEGGRVLGHDEERSLILIARLTDQRQHSAIRMETGGYFSGLHWITRSTTLNHGELSFAMRRSDSSDVLSALPR